MRAHLGSISIENVTVNVTANDRVKGTAAKVLSIVGSDPHATAVSIADQINMSERTVRRALKQLQNLGIIERAGSDKDGTWLVL